MFDAVASAAAVGPSWLQSYARNRNAAACLYKCSAPTALGLRRQGWKVLRIAEEALLTPMTFSEESSSRRQLRR
ncbi:hypothetical protein A9Q94_05120 [Rhodobacterales bacterium 56_14_T64]|nr:hypothetical protein A9Q94_05120 [Rhodobacterales bacterium 56_14_T64]